MNERLRGKVALVTGAGSGLGEATARALGAAGCAVAGLDLNGDGAERVAAALRAADTDAVGIACDVADAASVTAAVEQVIGRWGTVDVAVNCAAVDYVRSVEELTIEQWDRVIGVNLRGPFLIAKAVMPAMRRQRSGHIVNIASTASVRAWGNASAYHASKWGIVGFGRGLGVEGRPDNIRVTTVIPGGMRTHWFDAFPDLGIPMPDEANLQDPATVADAIVYAVAMPPGSVLQELILTPVTETSWP